VLNALDSLLDGALAIDLEKQVVYANESFANLIDTPLRRIKTGKKIDEYVSFPADFWNRLNDIAKTGDHSPYSEISFSSNSGTDVSCQFSVQKVEATANSYFLVFFRNVTLEKALQSKYRSELGQKEEYIKQLDRKLFEVSFLFEISSLINNSTSEESAVNQALKKTLQTFNFKSAYFLTGEDSKGTLSFRIESYVDKYVVVDDGSIQTPVIHWLHEDLNVRIFKDDPFVVENTNGRFVIIGLKGKNQSIGFLLFELNEDQATIKTSDLDLLKVMARQLAMTFDNEILYLKSITDEKTKLFNARYFSSTLKKEVQRSLRNQAIFGLLLVDIDHFKKFNDTYGHQTGDVVLKHVAQQIRAAIRNTDIAARYGGEEFAVMLLDTPLEGVQIVAERVRSSIESMKVKTDDHGELHVTASVGVALCPQHATNDKDLIEVTDRALYHAKRVGRNNVQFFDPFKIPAIS
jgi:diguanylate cyclase